MKVVLFCHSLASDWNHGNAHFLRGVARELVARGHDVVSYEPRDGWSRVNLLRQHGETPFVDYQRAFPELADASVLYDAEAFDLDAALDGADLVLVHEWSDAALVRRLGAARARGGGFRLLFHDTHHRAATRPEQMERYDLRDYDGVLAFGGAVRERYLEHGWAERVWVWHEAADTRLFRPLDAEPEADLVWVGNWGDGERTRELEEFLLVPAHRLELRGSVHGVRYPRDGRAAVAAAGLAYRGWVPNQRVPELFARHRVTVHVPRRPYVEALPGIPTIRPFEALACGIPLVTAPWEDVEGLFSPGEEFLVARDGAAMEQHLRRVLADRDLARSLSEHGLATIRARHTCAHRVDELLAIHAELNESNSLLLAGRGAAP